MTVEQLISIDKNSSCERYFPLNNRELKTLSEFILLDDAEYFLTRYCMEKN